MAGDMAGWEEVGVAMGGATIALLEGPYMENTCNKINM